MSRWSRSHRTSSRTTKLRGCNPSYVVPSDGVVVVDTAQLPTKAVAMRAEAESHGPIRYVVNTEHHVDHIFGDYWFKGAGTVIHHQGVAHLHGADYSARPVRLRGRSHPNEQPRGRHDPARRDVYFADPPREHDHLHRRSGLNVGDHTFECCTRPGTPQARSLSMCPRSASCSRATRCSRGPDLGHGADVDEWIEAFEHDLAR